MTGIFSYGTVGRASTTTKISGILISGTKLALLRESRCVLGPPTAASHRSDFLIRYNDDSIARGGRADGDTRKTIAIGCAI